jgi:iron complex transport system ATP-binding protein
MGDSILLQTDHLTTGYRIPRQPPRVVSEGLTLVLHAGELVCLIGPNGAGKSTLMQTLAGMLKPLAGSVMLNGQDLHTLSPTTLAKQVSIVLTERPNTGLLTGRGLVALGRHPHTDWTGQLAPHDQTMIAWAMDATGTAEFAERLVSELSDGQRQKVMIARALAQQPQVMLLDEPTAFLDLPRRVEVMRLLKTLAHETGCAVLLSNHDLDLALRTADQLWLMSSSEVMVGAPEDLVLNGSFERVFAGEGISFDRQTGTFDLSTEAHGTVHFMGDESLVSTWTRRALERAGYSLVSQSDAQTPRIESDAGGWTIHHNGRRTHCPTLYNLLRCLRNNQP